jgi:hypothetical protein
MTTDLERMHAEIRKERLEFAVWVTLIIVATVAVLVVLYIALPQLVPG